MISDSWFWGNNFFYGADDKRQIDQSVSVGTDVGYQFWKNETGKLSTAVGLTWINDELFSSVTDERLTWDWSFDNQPEEGNESIDRKVRFGINYTLE